MSYYGSNYGGGGYGGGYGGGAYPPPSSGPPPPPGGFGGYGGGAYNVNSYGTYGGGYSVGSAAPPGGQHGYSGGYQSGAVAGFTVPAVQQCSYQGVMPQQQQMPQSNVFDSFNNAMYQQQMQMQQMYQQQANAQRKMMRKNKKKGQEEEEDEEEEEEESSSSGGLSDEVKAHLKNVYKVECLKRLALSGTFDMTSGTVTPLSKYPEEGEDPVVVYHKSDDSNAAGEDVSGKKWDPELDCQYLRWAMKGLGTNEDAIIHVVTSRSNSQRQQMKKTFKTLYGRDLIEDLHSELSGNFRGTVMALFVPPARYDAWSIKEAIYGLGTDERSLIEVLMTRTNAQIQEMRALYPDVVSPNRKKQESVIEKDIEDDTSGDFKRLLISASQGGRNEITDEQLEKAIVEIERDGEGTGLFQVDFQKLANMDQAKRDAKKLFKAGEDKWGTDEETFIRIFATRDPYQLRATWDEYVKLTQRDILCSIDRETSGNFKKGLYTIVASIRCRPMFFAERLVDCMKGLGTNDDDLIRIIVSRSEIDMVQIKQCFLEKTKQTLWRWLKDDCSGDYKKLLQALVGRD